MEIFVPSTKYNVPRAKKQENFNADLFTKMEIEDVKQKIAELAKEHHALDMPDLDEIQFAEMIEEDVTALICPIANLKDIVLMASRQK